MVGFRLGMLVVCHCCQSVQQQVNIQSCLYSTQEKSIPSHQKSESAFSEENRGKERTDSLFVERQQHDVVKIASIVLSGGWSNASCNKEENSQHSRYRMARRSEWK